MENKSKIRHWPQDEDSCWPDQFTQMLSLQWIYANEGDEFLDDAIATIDPDFDQIDGTLEVWRMRSARAAKNAK